MPTSLTGPPDSIWQEDPENCEICNQMQDISLQNQISPITEFAAYVARSVTWLPIMQLWLQREIQLTTPNHHLGLCRRKAEQAGSMGQVPAGQVIPFHVTC